MGRASGMGGLLACLLGIWGGSAWAQAGPANQAVATEEPASSDELEAAEAALDGGDEPPFERYDEGGFAYVFGGLLSLDLDDLNATLLAHGYGAIEPIFVTMGTGAFVTSRRILLGLETYQTVANEAKRSADNRAGLDGTFWLGHLAYLFNVGPVHLYPILGVGLGTWTLGLVQGRPSFEDVMGERPPHAELEFHSFLLQFALGAEYLISISRSADEVQGIIAGIRLGYSVSPLASSWQLSGVGLDPAPDMRIRAPYACIVLGYGSWSASDNAGLPIIGN